MTLEAIGWYCGWLTIGATLGVLMLEHPSRRDGTGSTPSGWVAGWAVLWPLLAARQIAESLIAWSRNRLR